MSADRRAAERRVQQRQTAARRGGSRRAERLRRDNGSDRHDEPARRDANELTAAPTARYRPVGCAISTKSRRRGGGTYESGTRLLKLRHKTSGKDPLEIINEIGMCGTTWIISGLVKCVSKRPAQFDVMVSESIGSEIHMALGGPICIILISRAFAVIQRPFGLSFLCLTEDFWHVREMDGQLALSSRPRAYRGPSRLSPGLGWLEVFRCEEVSGDLISIIHDFKREVVNHIEARPSQQKSHLKESFKFTSTKKPKIAVVGSGPSGLFASLVLAELGAEVTLIERGQPVEKRGRDIGALVVRRMLQLESNFCFGEGGAGTWSDGKLVTRIGRNSDGVVAVLKTLVHFGAPRNILVDGKPHLGTDRLVPLLRNFRQHLQGLGVTIRFGTRVDDLLVENAKVVGVKVSDTESDLLLDNQKLGFDAIVLAVGHSARDVYQMLHSNNVELVPKDFSVGLRIEHPQELINRIQYSTLANEVCKGRGKVPVADYKVVKYVDEEGTDANSRENGRSCYSFCMCPGGQVVLTSTNPSELCINGMSFSRRASRWANAALVVTISWKDFDSLGFHGPLAGIEFQREFERRAALMGGGNFVVPVQKHLIIYSILALVVDVPPSSYRLGVKSAELHDLYPNHITEALQNSISMFDRELPGFISEEALLHGVETRTSAPVQIPRNTDTYESTSLEGLYPIGEGAGYAGGIVSAAVDGLYAGFAVAKNLNLYTGSIESILGKPMKNTGFVKY
ncbi:hypothetical protein Syun_025194 [Stephania yunnanensis]|uniref:FAD-binding domain-containing protein n=1 Tax=Stephania yunnanensis TaxID=152371 RepID=A0AAP0ERP5_9MAGN